MNKENQYYGYVSKDNKVYLSLLTSNWEQKWFQKNAHISFVKDYISVFSAKDFKEAMRVAEKKYLGV